MKKFNLILAIAAVALTSVFGFTSCDKNDDSINGQTTVPQTTTKETTADTGVKEQVKSTYEYQYFVSDNVLSLGDYEITVEQDGQATTQMVSEGQTAVETFDNADRDNPQTYELSGHRLVLGNIKAGAKVTVKFVPNEAAISALPADGTITYGICRETFCNSSKMRHSEFGENELPNSYFMQAMTATAKLAGINF